jgi:hypothetical protein
VLLPVRVQRNEALAVVAAAAKAHRHALAFILWEIGWRIGGGGREA